MKILIAHKYLFRGGGTATYLLALIEELEKRGHEIIPFTVAYDQTVTNAYSEYYVSPPGDAADTHLNDLKKTPVQMLKLFGRAVYSTEAFRKALALVDAAKPDVAYVNNIYSYMSPSILRAFQRRRIPIVMRVADFNMICPGMTLRLHGEDCRRCIRGAYWHAPLHGCHQGSRVSSAARTCVMYAHRWLRLYDAVDEFITPSGVLRDLLIEAGLPAARVRQVRSFYHASDGETETDLIAPASQQPYVLYFGRIDAEKGLGTLIRAFALCGSDTRLVIAGGDVDGERRRLESIVAQLGLENVQFTGHLGRQELDALIRGCLFTVIPSEMFDNCPMCVLESFSHGKPVVGSRIGGIPEQITPEVGYLFKPGDVHELAHCLQRLIADADQRQAMGAAARERLLTAYSPQAHCDTLLEIFQGLLARNNAGPRGSIAGEGRGC